MIPAVEDFTQKAWAEQQQLLLGHQQQQQQQPLKTGQAVWQQQELVADRSVDTPTDDGRGGEASAAAAAAAAAAAGDGEL